MSDWPIRQLGSASHPTILFLHGFLGSGESWEKVALQLSDAFHCLLIDLPEHGQNASTGRWPSLENGLQPWKFA